MENIKLNNVTFYIKSTFKELTALEYYKFINVLKKPIKNEYTKEDLDIKIRNTKEFETKVQHIYTEKDKLIELFSCISNIPKFYFDNEYFYEEMSMYLSSIIEDLLKVESETRTYYDIEGKRYFIDYEIHKWVFQKWCDVEGALSDSLTKTPLHAFTLILQQKNVEYFRFHYDYDLKISHLYNMPAYKVVGTINKLLEIIRTIRYNHSNLYTSSGGSTTGPNMKNYLNNAKWEDVIISLSETQAFNSPKGTLYAIRNAETLDVLNYLKFKAMKAHAENEDYKIRKNNKDGSTI